MEIRLGVRGAREVEALARRFERAAAGLQGRLTGAVRSEAAPALAAVRSAWLGVEVSSSGDGGERSGLRARTAAATRMSPIAGGVSVVVDDELVDRRYGRTLVNGLDGQTWSHPIFGIAGTSTSERGQEVFFSTLRGRAWEPGLERVVDQTVREIEG